MKKNYKILSAGALLVVGIGTITLFQNCSSGSVPVDTSSASATPTAAAVTTPLLMYPAATSVTAGGSVILTVTGGTSPYRFSATSGSVTSDPLAGYIFSAPATAGSAVITVTDSLNATYTASLTIVVATATTPTPVVSTSIPIYRFFNPTTRMHSFSQSQTFPGATQEGIAYYLAANTSGGGVAFFQCAYNPQGPQPSMFYYDTTQQNCEGYQSTPTLLGYIYANSTVANTQPLYRFRYEFNSSYGDSRGFAVDHIDSPSSTPPAQGWILESVLGYVPLN